METLSRMGLPGAFAKRLRVFAALCATGVIAAATTADAQQSTIWPDSAAPVVASVNDPQSVELGVKFRADTAGKIVAIRFFKGASNTGPHIGNLWESDGRLLASAVFSDESAFGWQTVNLPAPVSIEANRIYVASYFTSSGNYAASNNEFAAQGVDNPPLHALSNAVSGGNGVFAYALQSSFPSLDHMASNYWVDVVFEPNSTPAPQAAPIVVLTSAANKFTQYYTQILRAEGLNEFNTADVSTLSASLLANHDVAILGAVELTDAQVTILTNWVNAGGNLIAMRPDKKLAPLLGLTDVGSTYTEAYLRVARSGPGRGIVNETIQYHDVADRYTLSGAQALATLYLNSTTSTSNPAVTLRSVGMNGGHAAAFTYDLARSVVYTRQGDPTAIFDNIDPIRPHNFFQPDYVNLDKVAIPQADEQQRLLANLITHINLAKKPLPRFWYLPSGHKAAVVHALDSHELNVSVNRIFQKFLDASPAGCSVTNWQCPRATAWVYTLPQLAALSDAQAAAYNAQGFELGVHVTNGGHNFAGYADLDDTYRLQLKEFRDNYPSLPPQTTHRYHAIVWSDWLTQARVMEARGIRLSLDYYYWPSTWAAGRAGLFTGSGFPMLFADTDGSTVDVYQGVSHLVNETDLGYPGAIDTVLDRAVGAEGYYGIFGTHDDYTVDGFADQVLGAALARGVPLITAQQALTWLDGRNGSSFSNLSWNGTTLRFDVSAAAGATNLRGMLPLNSAGNSLSSLTKNGVAVPTTVETIKGVQYAFFASTDGPYVATYNGAVIAPPSGGATIWPITATPLIASVDDARAVTLGVKLRSDKSGKITGIRFYKGIGNTGTHVGTLWGSDGTALASATFVDESATGWQQVNFPTPVAIEADRTYVASYHTTTGRYSANIDYFATSGTDNGVLHALSNAEASGNGVFAYGPAETFPTDNHSAHNYWVDVVFVADPPKSLWSTSTTPAKPFVEDPSAVELGVKFRSDVSGRVKGIRFFKAPRNSGIHVGTLWDTSGNRLAGATFTNETDAGWQEVLFETSVDIPANTTYIVSYFAPNGYYSAQPFYFDQALHNAPLHAPASVLPSDGNGVYKVGAGFPAETYRNNNYWVDVIFEPNP